MSGPGGRAIIHGPNYKWHAFGALAVGSFISVISHGSVIVALPTIAQHFHTDLPTAQWVVIGEALTVSALLLPMGRLSDMVGRKQIYVLGLSIFVLGSTLAALSPNITSLILSKVSQGVGAAMTQGTAMAMVTTIFPSNERGKALGTHGSVIGTGAVAGPALGGLLVGALGWQWIFWINIPAGIIAIAAAQVILDKSLFIQDAPGRKYDWLGAALSVGILITFLLAMTNGQRAGWLGLPILAGLVGSGAFLAVFIWWELHISYPMLDLRLFKQRLFSLGVSAAFLSFLGMSSVRFLMPFYLQTVMGYSPGQVGLILIPNALCMILIRPLSGRLSDLYGWRKFNVGGLALSTAGLFILSRVTETSPLGLVMGGMILQSSGMATFGSPNQSSIFAGIERRSYGVVSALLSLVRNSANVTSIALATAIVAAVMVSMGHPPSLAAVAEAPGAFTAGLRTAFLAMGIILMAGVLVSFLKGDRAKAIREATPRRT